LAAGDNVRVGDKRGTIRWPVIFLLEALGYHLLAKHVEL